MYAISGFVLALALGVVLAFFVFAVIKFVVGFWTGS